MTLNYILKIIRFASLSQISGMFVDSPSSLIIISEIINTVIKTKCIFYGRTTINAKVGGLILKRFVSLMALEVSCNGGGVINVDSQMVSRVGTRYWTWRWCQHPRRLSLASDSHIRESHTHTPGTMCAPCLTNCT